MPKERSPDALAEAANTIRDAVARLSGAKRSLEAERVELVRRIELLLSLPVGREDAKQFIFDSIDLLGAEFPQVGNWGKVFEVFAYPRGGGREERRDGKPINLYARGAPLSLRDIEQVAGSGSFQGLMGVIGGPDGADFFSGGGTIGPGAASRAFFFFGDLIKAKIDAHFDEFFPHLNAAHSEEESTVADRRAEIQRGTLRIGVIDDEVSGLRQQLAELERAGRST